jgi:hypothetical protein
MIDMDLDQYLERIAWHSEALRMHGDWFYSVVQPWIEEVAPHKTVEYGIECWKRLGSKGLVVDINACYYRWQHQRGFGLGGPSLNNALVDLYGYTAMYCVCLAAERHMPQMPMSTNSFSDNEPEQLNDWLIEHVWNQTHPNVRVLSASRLVATSLAKRAWEEYHG